MKSIDNIRNKQTLSPFWVLMVLLALFSSCTIRKGVQASLHVPVSEQLNPSKTTAVNYTGCIYFEADESKQTVKNESSIHNLLLLSNLFIDEILTDRFTRSGDENKFNGWPLTKKVKQYILFSRLKYDIL